MSKHLGPKPGIIEILDHYTRQISLDRQTKPAYNPLRPSGSGKCERELAYGFMEYRGLKTYEKRPQDPNVTRLLSLGHSIEWNLIRHFDEAFKVATGDKINIKTSYKQQVVSFFEIAPGELLEGSVDLVFVSDKWKMLADIKSKKDKFSRIAPTNWEETSTKLREMKTVKEFGTDCFWVDDLEPFLEELNDPFFAGNFLQLNFYYHSEDEFFKIRDIECCSIIQYNKNDSRLREVRFRPCQKVYENTKRKFLKVAHTIDNFKDPEKTKKDYALGSIKCAFCDYSKQCWGEKNTREEYFATWPKKKWPRDTNRLTAYKRVEELFEKYEHLVKQGKELKPIEQEICKILDSEKVNKIKLKNGNVYDMRILKTNGLVIRRGKM